ncbi:hypothetical protein XaFJ1_GM002439 [Xanthomonas albilineans]|nr:hypothetical protein XaFJ1_GM002439 [Xanthomonas albilineans]
MKVDPMRHGGAMKVLSTLSKPVRWRMSVW